MSRLITTVTALALAVLASASLPHPAASEPAPIVLCAPNLPGDLDPARPHDASIVPLGAHQIFDRLVAVSGDGLTLEPRLARWWDIVDDGRAVVFKLRRGVTFQSREDFTPTRPMGPEDVVFSLERLIDPDHPFHPEGGPHHDFGSIIESVAAEDGDRVRITLKAPHAGFLHLMAMDDASILSAEHADTLTSQEARDQLVDRPIGTGPFLVDTRDDESITLRPHAGHWSGEPPASGLLLRRAADTLSRFQGTSEGSCDITLAPDPADLDDLSQNAGVDMITLPRKAVVFLAFNTVRAPFDDRRVRRALASAIDASVRPDGAVAAVRITTPHPDIDAAMLAEPDIDGARSDLANAGLQTFPVSLLAAVIPSGSARDPSAEALARSWEALGATTSIAAVSWENFWTAWASGDHDAALIAFEPDAPDDAVTLRGLLACSPEPTVNVARWCSEAFDSAIDRAITAVDPEARSGALAEASAILSDQVPIVPLFRPALTVSVARTVLGASASVLMHGDLHRLSRASAQADGTGEPDPPGNTVDGTNDP